MTDATPPSPQGIPPPVRTPWPGGPPPPAPPGAIGVPALPGAQASFGSRAGGHLLDAIILQVLLGVVFLIGFFVVAAGSMGQRSAIGVFVAIWLLVVVFWAGGLALQIGYEMLAGRPRGQTYGKHVLATVVVDSTTGQPGIGYRRAAVRFLAKWLSGAVFGIGFLWMLWDPNQRTLHDLMTGTTVVNAPRGRTLSPVEYARSLDMVPGT